MVGGEKNALRRLLRQRRKQWEESYCPDSDRAIAEHLRALPQWRRARRVFIYVSVRSEPDTRELIRAALAEGRSVAVPRCVGGGEMLACEISSLDQLRPVGYGLFEPEASAPVVDPGDIDLCVIPCVAADRSMRRLGHGAGYYDRYLARVSCPKICLCRGRELLENVPTDRHDIPMDMIITEHGPLTAADDRVI